jgi:hypothetical protein
MNSPMFTNYDVLCPGIERHLQTVGKSVFTIFKIQRRHHGRPMYVRQTDVFNYSIDSICVFIILQFLQRPFTPGLQKFWQN